MRIVNPLFKSSIGATPIVSTFGDIVYWLGLRLFKSVDRVQFPVSSQRPFRLLVRTGASQASKTSSILVSATKCDIMIEMLRIQQPNQTTGNPCGT